MAHCLDQPYEFSLICWEFGVMRSHRAAEERDGATTLVQDRAEPGSGGVAVDDEARSEIRQLESGAGREGVLELDEGLHGEW